ncbi:hypothetical protein DM02DRAFT_405921 [Periconia macrospinosa]|uniref:Uncharacterized protein n=1 Tax=Periconia macrospinosa TaxID=97972 RepID=A0A2V1E9F3_9PLEO|nr:hypothetical protein DM02DRAFT_405921 [Periconia macrospinosa]
MKAPCCGCTAHQNYFKYFVAHHARIHCFCLQTAGGTTARVQSFPCACVMTSI